MKRSYFILFALLFPLVFSSCATLIHGSKHKVRLESNPSGADVIINGKEMNIKTPAELKLPRKVEAGPFNAKNEYVYVFKKENYADYVYRDQSKFNGLTYIDYYLGYVVGGLIDHSLGADRLYNEIISTNLVEHQTVVQTKTDTIFQKEIVYVETASGKPAYVFERKSDVNRNIPKVNSSNPYRFALIIGNEDYSSHQLDLNKEIDVEFARNDASAFKDYALSVLAIPEQNIIFLLDATTGQMNQSISKMNLIIKNTGGKADVYVYYAGHGLPDEQTKEPYIMPVDVSGRNAGDGIKLNDFYKKLSEYPSKRVTVFIDACFSGGARNQGLLAARGVKVKPKEDLVSGNLVVFTASSGDQSSLPYKDKNHGFFTYFLLKKLQETAGNISYNDLSEYLKENISLQSVLLNDKEQTPQVIISPSAANQWSSWTFR